MVGAGRTRTCAHLHVSRPLYHCATDLTWWKTMTSISLCSCTKPLYPCSTEILAHPSLVGSKVYFFWSPMEDYCVTVWWIWFVFVDYQVSVWRVWRGLMRWKRWKRPMKELIPLFHWAFCSSFTRRKQGLFLLITHGRLSCHSQMNLICVCRLSGQCLACQV